MVHCVHVLTVKFTSGEEKQLDADSGPLFVLHKWNPKRRKLESGACFPAEQVACARLPNGNIIVGAGRVKSD